MPSSTPETPDDSPPLSPGRSRWSSFLWIAAAVVTGFILVDMWRTADDLVATEELSYTAFLDEVDEGRVTEVTIAHDGGVEGKLEAPPGGDDGDDGDETSFSSQLPVGLDPQDLLAQLDDQGVEVTAKGEPGSSWMSVLLSLSPMLLLIALWVWFSRRAKGMGGLLGGVGRSKAKVIDAERPTTRFADVAGYEGVKEELREIVDFLKTPERFGAAGATGPRGALMVGPPGTGKTLIARAVAGEASVPVLSVTGSAFVEMFVGVGAARVRDLFEEARKRAPAIIFVDEIDAIGQRRGSGGAVSNDEREQTLNQLLAEMDGFDPTNGIVVLAATNRPDVLDDALLRPGRFDRQIVVPLPNLLERRAILGLHCENKNLDPGVDLDAISRATPGFSGADLANLANEAAIFAVRGDRTVVTQSDFDDARTRIVLGRREGSSILLPRERESVAVHEAGHALVAAFSDEADPVASITILPAGQSLGATEQLPIDERHLYSESYLTTSLTVYLAGRAAEELVFGQGSTGAANDLARATDIATRMVREYGLSPRLGPVGYATTGSMYLGTDRFSARTYSEATQRAIDREVSRLVSEAQDRATAVLRSNRDHLDALADLLLEHETVAGETVYDMIHRPNPSPTATVPTPSEEDTDADGPPLPAPPDDLAGVAQAR